ncbi:hypothetical protein B6672_004255 [Campylobacter jejuni]
MPLPPLKEQEQIANF